MSYDAKDLILFDKKNFSNFKLYWYFVKKFRYYSLHVDL